MLGSEHLTWRDLLIIVQQTPPGSPIHYAVDPEAAAWSSGEIVPYVLAQIADLIAMSNWQRAGNKNAPRPPRLPRPGDKANGKVYGREPVRVADFDDWWNSHN